MGFFVVFFLSSEFKLQLAATDSEAHRLPDADLLEFQPKKKTACASLAVLHAEA